MASLINTFLRGGFFNSVGESGVFMVGVVERELEFELEERLVDGGRIDVLAEVRLVMEALEAESRGEMQFCEDNLAYVEENELKRLIEAVTDGVLFVSFQEWDGQEFKAFGRRLLELYLARVAALKKLCQSQPEFDWELERNLIELAEESDWTGAQKKGLLDENMGVVISPFPNEVDSWAAGSFGYKSETRQTMIRGVHNDSEGRRVMEQVGVVWSREFSMEVFTKLLRRLGIVGFRAESTAQVLGSRVLLSRERYPGGIVDVVRIYDEVLSEETGGKRKFFCGREVGSEEERRYERLGAEREVIEKKVSGFVSRLLDLDVGLANWFLGRDRTEENVVVKVAKEAIAASDEWESDQVNLISQFLTTRVLTEEVGGILKQFEFLRVASATMVLIDEDEARRKFGDIWVNRIRLAANERGWSSDGWWAMMAQMVVETRPSFAFCGGVASLDGGLYPSWESGESTCKHCGSSEGVMCGLCKTCAKKYYKDG